MNRISVADEHKGAFPAPARLETFEAFTDLSA